MPKVLTEIESITLHPGDSGISVVSVWFSEGRDQHEKVTFSPYDLFDYRLFCSRVLEMTGHPFHSSEVEDAPDPWRAEMSWRDLIRRKLEGARVEPQFGAHWKPLLE